MAVTYEVVQNLANLWINVAFFKIQNNTGNRKFVGQERKKRKKKKKGNDPYCNTAGNSGFPPREQLKGIAGTVEVMPYTAMSLLWITLLLDVWVDVYLSACSRACLFVCAVLCVSLIFEQSHHQQLSAE